MEDTLLPSVKEDNMTQKAEEKTGWGTKVYKAYVWDWGGFLELLPKLKLIHGDDRSSDR